MNDKNYRTNKISMDDREVLRKRALSNSSYASFFHEEFSCGGCLHEIAWSEEQLRKTKAYGISKKESRISRTYYVNKDGYEFSK
jgi:hypothetical protein